MTWTGWDDIVDTIQGRKPGVMAWSCNCKAPITEGREQVFTKLYPTKVDKEGICIFCGHYAYQIEARTLAMTWQRGKVFRNINYKRRNR